MKKAYELQGLVDALKKRGIHVAEEAAGDLYEAMKEWFKDSAALSSSPIDDVVVSFLPQLDKIVLPAIDKIDGEVSSKA